MKSESILALRTLLNASFSLTLKTDVVEREQILTDIAKDITSGMSFLSSTSIHSNYLGMYSLQTHPTEKQADETHSLIHPEIKLLAKLLAKCLDLYQNLLAEQLDKQTEKIPQDGAIELFLRFLFQRLNLHSYTQLEHFDIRLWQIFLRKHFNEVQITGVNFNVGLADAILIAGYHRNITLCRLAST